ncbi:MAG: transposase [Planctomycetes bacterium]|nr:transposase [Planctomycetota bacterium]
MPRPVRKSPGDACCHVINRGNGRANVFHKEDDFLAFERILSLGCERHSMRVLAWCLMNNHFHLVLWPRRKDDLPRFMQWVTTCHVRRYHRHYEGSGHVWQGRYKSFICQPDQHLLSVLRYVERNPVRAGMVKRAQDWRFSSAWPPAQKGSGTRLRQGSGASQTAVEPDLQPAYPLSHYLTVGPIKRPKPWLRFVNREEEAEKLERLREAVARNAPFGDDAWQKKTAKRLGLQSTIRPRGRPKK